MGELIGAIVNLFSPAFWVFLISLVVAAPFLVGSIKDWREPPPPKPPTPPTFVERCLDGFFNRAATTPSVPIPVALLSAHVDRDARSACSGDSLSSAGVTAVFHPLRASAEWGP